MHLCQVVVFIKGGVSEDLRGAKSTKLFFGGENEIGADFDTLTSLVTVQ